MTGPHCSLCAPVAFVARRLAGKHFAHPDYGPVGPVDVTEVSVEESENGSDFSHAVPVVTLSTEIARPPQVLYCPTPALTSVSEKDLAVALEVALKYTR